jgi:hypothetical protein
LLQQYRRVQLTVIGNIKRNALAVKKQPRFANMIGELVGVVRQLLFREGATLRAYRCSLAIA